VWTQDLLSILKSQLPRWRWQSKLNYRGGTIEGTSQKDQVKIEVSHHNKQWDAVFLRQVRAPSKKIVEEAEAPPVPTRRRFLQKKVPPMKVPPPEERRVPPSQKREWTVFNEVSTGDLEGLVSNIKQFCSTR
jgi:hypothetical protein